MHLTTFDGCWSLCSVSLKATTRMSIRMKVKGLFPQNAQPVVMIAQYPKGEHNINAKLISSNHTNIILRLHSSTG